MKAEEIISLIQEAIPDAHIEVTDLRGDGDHYAAKVESALFAGKTRIQQHQMVYEALEGRVGGVLHALSLTTVPVPGRRSITR
jgi:stress-induced morphogen